MGVDAGMPPGLWERVRRIAQDELAKFARSGFLRNASITDGGLTIRGGFLRLLFGNVPIFYVGPVSPALPDGTGQQGLTISRADGAVALAMFDQAPDPDGTLRQALTWFDRNGSVVLADDTESGQGLARPYLPVVFYPATFEGNTFTTASTFTTIWRATAYKQHPRLIVAAGAVMSAAGQTGELRVLVDGQPLGSTLSVASTPASGIFGPAAVGGAHEANISIEIQARCVSAGQINVAVFYGYGLQT